MTVDQTVDLRQYVRDIPDFPKKGILFRDVMPLLADPVALRQAVDRIAEYATARQVNLVLGAEARGFILGAAVAYAIGAGFVCARKPGKLPWTTVQEEYALEYGTDSLSVHADAIKPGDNVLGVAFLVELSDLRGREKLAGLDVMSLITY